MGRRRSVFFCGYALFAGVQQVLARHRHKGRRGWGGERFPGAARTRGGAGPGGGNAGGWNRPFWGADGFPAAHPLSRLEQRDFPNAAVRRRSGETGRSLSWILRRFRPDTFEMRFSLRLSSVLTLGFLFSRLSGCNHAYWFVLNAFLLLQPMYEDSAFRLKTALSALWRAARCCILRCRCFRECRGISPWPP